ncbi:MAG: hypothetical protein JSW59_02055 [Phycisphaerales bacterium]|nr:MAG: hypothetical protein JSW59_02055 [Phycisphaerales bacterium]
MRTNITKMHLAACSVVLVIHASACFGRLSFTDITLKAGTSGPTGKGELGGHGIMFADVDQDSLPDLYITMIIHF